MLEQLIQDCPEAFVVAEIGETSCVLLWSAGARALFGYTSAEVTGRPLSVLVPADASAHEELRTLTSGLAGDSACSIRDVLRRHQDGTLIPVDISFSSVADDAAGRLVLVVYHDLRERLALLERLQQERRAVFGALTAKLAHEVRNPLSSILLNLALVRVAMSAPPYAGTVPPADPEELIASAQSQVQRIQTVLDRYVEAARGAGCLGDVDADLAEFLT